MPDVDFKNIPVLDDIIEIDEIDPAKPVTIDALAPDQADNNFDLFADGPTEAEITNLIDTSAAEIGAIDEAISNDPVDNDIGIYTDVTRTSASVFDETTFTQEAIVDSILLDSAPPESALVDQHADETIDNDSEAQLIDEEHSASLEHIVNDVVKQILPDLEQQLRFLVQQALQDKLPENIITQLSDKSDR
ncbi:MAG: hypothetical protein RQ982_03925 [Gammaproteobacteria bacterium]|nr:hypothetical protein [Gammaproteobacteria bacterium]